MSGLQTGGATREPRGQLALLTIEKTCIRCRVPQPESAYYDEAAAPDGLQAICKQCSRDRAHIWYVERAAERVEANLRWRHGNPEKARQLSRRQLRRRRLGRDSEALEWSYIVLGDPCAYCGAPAEHVGHIEAVARGGSNEWVNLTAACATCNSAKSDRPLLPYLLQRQHPLSPSPASPSGESRTPCADGPRTPFSPGCAGPSLQETERTCCAGCGDVNPEHWREGGWYCEGCASCEVCESPYCDNPEHVL